MKKNYLSIAIIISMVLMLTGCTSHKALQAALQKHLQQTMTNQT